MFNEILWAKCLGCAWHMGGPPARSLPSTEGRECSREGNGPQGEEVRGKGNVDTAWAGHIQLSVCLEGKAKQRNQRFNGELGSQPQGGFFAGCLGHSLHLSDSVSPTEKWILVMIK